MCNISLDLGSSICLPLLYVLFYYISFDSVGRAEERQNQGGKQGIENLVDLQIK